MDSSPLSRLCLILAQAQAQAQVPALSEPRPSFLDSPFNSSPLRPHLFPLGGSHLSSGPPHLLHPQPPHQPPLHSILKGGVPANGLPPISDANYSLYRQQLDTHMPYHTYAPVISFSPLPPSSSSLYIRCQLQMHLLLQLYIQWPCVIAASKTHTIDGSRELSWRTAAQESIHAHVLRLGTFA